MAGVTVYAARQRRIVMGAGALLLGMALLLYLFTLDNGLAPGELIGGDLITHQYAQVEARPSNAPGYPLYTMGGWAWFHGLRGLLAATGSALPNPIPILSSYSMLWAILALGLLYALIVRLTRSATHPAGNWPLALLLGAFYAVTYFFWYYATTTEQYTSAIAQTLALVYVYVLWSAAAAENAGADGAHSKQPAGSERRQNTLLVLLAFLCGLSLAHMLTVAFIVPPLVVAVLWQQPRLLRNWRLVGLCVLAALLPLGSYWYIWVRGSTHPQWWGEGEWRNAQEWFWSFVSTAQGRDELSWGFQAACAFFDNGFPALIWQELSIPILLLGVGGIAFLQRPLSLMLYATLAIYLVFNWMYRCANWYQAVLPAYPLLLLGVAAAAERWEGHFRTHPPRWLRHAPAILLLLAVAWRATASWERADSSDRPGDTALTRAGVLLDQPLPPGGALFAATEDALALDYLIHIWGMRPDLEVVSSAQAAERLGVGKPVFSTYDAAAVLLSELPPELSSQRSGAGPDWLRVQRPPLPLRAPDTPLERELAPGVILKGYTVESSPRGIPVTDQVPGADVTLYWGLLGAWPESLGISLRPTQGGAFIPDPAGEEGAILQVDATAPLHGLALPGDPLLADSYRVPLPEGADGILLIVYERTADGFRDILELPLEIGS